MFDQKPLLRIPKPPNKSKLLQAPVQILSPSSEELLEGSVDLDWASIYPDRLHWNPSDLDSPFSEHELYSSIFLLHSDDRHVSSSSPPLCFFQAYYPFLKHSLLDSLLQPFHRCNVSPLPTCFGPHRLPTGTHRLLRSLLANRLRARLHLLTDASCAAPKPQFFLDSVSSAKSILESCREAHLRHPSLFLNLQFQKAFKTIRWDFVLSTLSSRRISSRWAHWIFVALFSTLDTKLRRGLIDDDPLSLCLFMIAVDSFSMVMWRGRFAGMLRAAPGKFFWPNNLASLRYARDVLLLVPDDRDTLVNMKVLFYLFETVSGLWVEFDRSCVYSLAGDKSACKRAARLLDCRVGKYPFLYFGMVVTSISLDVEGDEDCCILDYDPFDNTKEELEKKIVSHRQDRDTSDEDEDVTVLVEKGQVACRDYPHSRHLCAKYPFNKTAHENYCPQCYCYVCDVLAPCSDWNKGNNTDHCNASDDMVYWRILRISHRTPTSSTEMIMPNIFQREV